MTIESIMYFALGVLAAALVALIIMPAIWRRAVRLTKKRIEAATPITLSEFRADKDQLRAEFALSTRRLEMSVEALRKRLSEQMGDIGRKKSDLAALKNERDEHLSIVGELEEREAELRDRVFELEKEGMALADTLTRRDADYGQKLAELEATRAALRANLPVGLGIEEASLSGDYEPDVEALLAALAVERKRTHFLEEQARGLIGQLERLDRRAVESSAAILELRKSLAFKDDTASQTSQELASAEVRIASAETRLNALLEETSELVSGGDVKREQLLAEKLSMEAQLNQLRERVMSVESTLMGDWDTERLEQAQLRERLNDIASEVSRLVYAVDGHAAPDPEESLFDRVQRFADDGLNVDQFPANAGALVGAHGRAGNGKPGNGFGGTGAGGNGHSVVSDRMAALREIQSRH